MDKEGKGILKENKEGKGLFIIPYPYPPYRAGHICAYTCPITAPIYGHVCAHACPIAAPIYGPCMRACMPHCCSRVAHVCAHACPIAAPIYGYVCAYACPIAAPVWPIYARMHAPLLLPCGPYIRVYILH